MSDAEEEAFSAWAAEPRPGERHWNGQPSIVPLFDRQTEAPSASPEGAPVPAGGPPGGGAIEDAIDTAIVKGLLPPGMFMTSDHRYYFNGEGPFPSVTTVIDVMSKPALITWKAKEAARAMYHAHEPSMERNGLWTDEESAVNWALKEADKARDTAASIGSGVHLLADMASRASESDPKGFEIPDHIQPYLQGFRGFLARFSGSQIVSSEKAIWNLNGYAGTYDLIMLMPCEECRISDQPVPECAVPDTWLIDIKTSKGYYPEYGLQLSAYAHGDFIGLPNDPHRYTMPQIDRAGVLHLRPDMYKEGWRLIEYPITDRDYIAFLGALELYNWREEKRFQKSKLIGT